MLLSSAPQPAAGATEAAAEAAAPGGEQGAATGPAAAVPPAGQSAAGDGGGSGSPGQAEVAAAARRCGLYCALCTKRHSLLPRLLEVRPPCTALRAPCCCPLSDGPSLRRVCSMHQRMTAPMHSGDREPIWWPIAHQAGVCGGLAGGPGRHPAQRDGAGPHDRRPGAAAAIARRRVAARLRRAAPAHAARADRCDCLIACCLRVTSNADGVVPCRQPAWLCECDCCWCGRHLASAAASLKELHLHPHLQSATCVRPAAAAVCLWQ